MNAARPLTYFAFVITENFERFIELATPPYAPNELPILVATMWPNQTVTFSHNQTLNLADLQLVARLAANYPAADKWLLDWAQEHVPDWSVAKWLPLPKAEVAKALPDPT